MRYNFTRVFVKLTALSAMALMMTPAAFAGNEDRAGAAAGMQLLINPWARSTGLANANMASASPVESMFLNVAGMSTVRQTEVAFTYMDYLSGSGISLNSIGLSQRVGESSVLGLAVSTYGFGDIMRTTTSTPDGDGSTFNINVVNIGLSYAKAFSNSIYGGITLKVLSESTADMRASGVAIDAGIKYVTGENDRVRFGIALKNVGPQMSFSGDGLTIETEAPGSDLYTMAAEMRSSTYEMPSLVSIGASYDFFFGELHTLTPHATFTANSFSLDQYQIAAEYNFKDMFYLRAGYAYEEGIFDDADRLNVYTGVAAGAGVQLALGENTLLSLDYSYRPTQPFNGTHAIGARIHLGSAAE